MPRHQIGDEYEIDGSLCHRHTRFRQYRDGELIATGTGLRDDAAIAAGGELLDLAPADAQGRRRVRGKFVTNAKGSHSGVNSRQYLAGWDRIFSKSN